jgi:hypothetical protein
MKKPLRSIAALALATGLLVSTVLVGTASAYTRRSAYLAGAKEVPGPGDPNGTGRAWIRLYPAKGKVCYRVRWNGIRNPSAAHIHKGGPNVAGDVAVLLFEGVVRAKDYKRGCVRGVEKALIRRIQRYPARWYVNVHNKPYPDGAIRGQLKRPA